MNLDRSNFFKWTAASAVAAGALFAAASANAHTSWSVGINVPGAPVYYEPAPLYTVPAPVYYEEPEPVYYEPAPRVYYRPPPVYYRPAPAYGTPEPDDYGPSYFKGKQQPNNGQHGNKHHS